MNFPITPDFEVLASMRLALITDKQLPAYLLMPEVERLISAAPNQHARLLFNLLWQTGGRLNEVLALRGMDIEFHPAKQHTPAFVYITLRTSKQRCGREGKPIRGRPAKSVEGSLFRSVPVFCPVLQRELAQYQQTFAKNKSRPIFYNQETGNSYTQQIVRKWMQLACEFLETNGTRLPIKVSPHTLRHSYAINLLIHNTDLRTISKMLGHSSLSSTAIYLNLWQAELIAKIQRVAFSSALLYDQSAKTHIEPPTQLLNALS